MTEATKEAIDGSQLVTLPLNEVGRKLWRQHHQKHYMNSIGPRVAMNGRITLPLWLATDVFGEHLDGKHPFVEPEPKDKTEEKQV